jgi:hypothetical protein
MKLPSANTCPRCGDRSKCSFGEGLESSGSVQRRGPSGQHGADYRASNWLMVHEQTSISVHDPLGANQ